jgi:hypothetical protein
MCLEGAEPPHCIGPSRPLTPTEPLPAVGGTISPGLKDYPRRARRIAANIAKLPEWRARPKAGSGLWLFAHFVSACHQFYGLFLRPDGAILLARLEPRPIRESSRIAFRNKKYFRTNCPSRATSAPPHIPHAASRSTVSGPALALTTWYRALQFGQRKNGGAFGLGMKLFAKILASRPAKRLATILKSASARRCAALIRIWNGLRLRSTDQKTVVEKSTNDRSAI